MSDEVARLGPYSEYADLMTPEEYVSMRVREPEAIAQYLQAGREWGAFVATASDEEIVRAYLRSRGAYWQQLPYDWMALDIEELVARNLLGCTPDVEAAYDRSRSDPTQRLRYEKEYGQDLVRQQYQRHGLRLVN